MSYFKYSFRFRRCRSLTKSLLFFLYADKPRAAVWIKSDAPPPSASSSFDLDQLLRSQAPVAQSKLDKKDTSKPPPEVLKPKKKRVLKKPNGPWKPPCSAYNCPNHQTEHNKSVGIMFHRQGLYINCGKCRAFDQYFTTLALPGSAFLSFYICTLLLLKFKLPETTVL